MEFFVDFGVKFLNNSQAKLPTLCCDTRHSASDNRFPGKFPAGATYLSHHESIRAEAITVFCSRNEKCNLKRTLALMTVIYTDRPIHRPQNLAKSGLDPPNRGKNKKFHFGFLSLIHFRE